MSFIFFIGVARSTVVLINNPQSTKNMNLEKFIVLIYSHNVRAYNKTSNYKC